MLKELSIPEIIKSVTGPQSMFVLMVLLLVEVCVLFFTKESAKIKITIFLILLACAVPFAIKIMTNDTKPSPAVSPVQPQYAKVLPGPAPGNSRPVKPSEPAERSSVKSTAKKQSHGFIRVESDGTTFVITGSNGEENHVTLGRDRVQKVYTAPDGRTGVVVFKVRESNQYMAIPVDLITGRDGDSHEISSNPSGVVFKNADAFLTYPQGGIQKIVLR